MSDIIWAALLTTVGVVVTAAIPYVVQERRRKADLQERHQDARHAAYARLLDAEAAARDALVSDAPGVPIREWRLRVEAARVELAAAKNVVDIVGSSRVRDATDAALDALVELERRGRDDYEQSGSQFTANAEHTRGGYAAALGPSLEVIQAARRQLVAAIRDDLKIDLPDA